MLWLLQYKPCKPEPKAPLETAGSQTETQPVTTSNTNTTTRTRDISLNWLLSLVSIGATLIAAMLTILILLIISLGNRIDANTTRIENLGTELRTEIRAEIGGLRAEMQAEIGGLRAEMQAEIGGLRAEIRAEIGGLRAEMQAGFAEIHAILRDHSAILRDHTDRLARLETAAGLPRPEN